MKVKELIEQLSRLDPEQQCVVIEDFYLDGTKMSANEIGVNEIFVDEQDNAFYIKDDRPVYVSSDDEDHQGAVFPQPTGQLKKAIGICPLC